MSAVLAPLNSLADNARNLPLLIEQLRTRVGVVPFVGAGMSVPFGFPAWRPFLELQAPDATVRERIVDLLDDGQYEEAAERLLKELKGTPFQAAIADTFGEKRLPTPLPAGAIPQLPRLCLGPVLTTNFDPVLEKVFENARRPFEERILGMNVKALRGAFDQSRRVLVKLHGDAADSSSRVLTRSDYERAYGDREPLKAVLRFAMQARPLLFLGCSLGKDRTVRVMEALAGELRKQKAEDLLEHYAVVERPRGNAEFAARHKRLKRLGIFPIWYPTGQHGMIAELLAYLAAKAGHDVVCGPVPAEPPHYLLRDVELTELRGKVLAGEGGSVAITGQGHALGVQGMGGVGKTVLAAALTRDAEVQKAFPDGIFWLTVTAQPNVLNLLNQLSSWLPDCEGPWTSETVAQAELREALAARRALLILDDVWDVNHAEALRVVSAPGRLLVTTRKREVLVSLGANECLVDVLKPEAAQRMLAEWAGEADPARLPPVAADVARECGYLPLALAMIGAMVKLRPTVWADALKLLQACDLEEFRKAFPDYPYPDLLRAIAVGVDELRAKDRGRYLDLAVFPKHEPAPDGPLQVLWGLTPAKTRARIDRFVARSLGSWQEKDGQAALWLHDLQGDYVRKVREKELPALHRRLLAGWGDVRKLPDAYAWRWLAYHLVQGGESKQLQKLLFDFGWLQSKLQATDVVALIADYGQLPGDEELRLVQSAIRNSAHAVGLDKAQLAGQMVARLSGEDTVTIRGLVAGARSWRGPMWLRSLNANLLPPGTALVRTLKGHAGGVRTVVLSADKRLVVSGSADGTLKVWDLESGQELRTLHGHAGVVWAVALSADGRRAVSGASDKTLKV